MATLQVSYITGDSSWTNATGATWNGQTFTTVGAFTVASVKLKLFRYLIPAVMTIEIYALDGSDHPTGAALASGTIDETTITQDSAGAWYTITFDTPVALSATTKYAIVQSVPAGDATHYIAWRHDSADSTYSGGNRIRSTDSGGSWSDQAASDFVFEVYDNFTFEQPSDIVTYKRLVAFSNNTLFYEDIS